MSRTLRVVTMNIHKGLSQFNRRMVIHELRDGLSVLDMHFLLGTRQGVEHFRETHELGLFSPEHFRAAFDAAGLRLSYDPVGPTQVGFYIGALDA